MNTEHDMAWPAPQSAPTPEVVAYLQERDRERRKNRRFWIVLTIAAALVGGLALSVNRNINAENRQHQQNVRDYTCAISGRDC